MKSSILGVMFDNYGNAETLEILKGYLKEDKNHIIITANPEMVMAAKNDSEFNTIMNDADLVLPDGIGIVIASRLLKKGINERVPGCDTVQALFEKTSATVYLLGGKPGVCELAKENIESKYKNIKVIGLNDGYFDNEKEILITEEIKRLKPDILLVGLGFPKQEKWIYKNKDLPVKISIGVGGTLDVLAGVVKRAPICFQKLGLEWFYRLIKQPSRIGRMSILPIFMLNVILFNNKRI